MASGRRKPLQSGLKKQDWLTNPAQAVAQAGV